MLVDLYRCINAHRLSQIRSILHGMNSLINNCNLPMTQMIRQMIASHDIVAMEVVLELMIYK